MTTRVMLVDDHELMRDGLRALFQDDEFEVVGEAGAARTARWSWPRPAGRTS